MNPLTGVVLRILSLFELVYKSRNPETGEKITNAEAGCMLTAIGLLILLIIMIALVSWLFEPGAPVFLGIMAAAVAFFMLINRYLTIRESRRKEESE